MPLTRQKFYDLHSRLALRYEDMANNLDVKYGTINTRKSILKFAQGVKSCQQESSRNWSGDWKKPRSVPARLRSRRSGLQPTRSGSRLYQKHFNQDFLQTRGCGQVSEILFKAIV